MGKATADVATYKGNLADAVGKMTTASNDRDQKWIDLLGARGEYDAVAKTTAIAGTVTSGDLGTIAGVGTVDTSAADAAAAAAANQLALTQTLLTQSNQTLAVSQAQYSVLQQSGNLLPFGGSFQSGGIVPGPAGQPYAVVAHGGEAIGQPAGGVNVRVIMEDNRTRVFVNDVEQAVETVNRRMATQAARGLPGGRYGWGT